MISTRGRYAVRMVIDLAMNQGDGYVSLKDIAERQQISKKYLEQIIPALNRAGILEAVRGFQGGYRLADSPDKISIADILKETEGCLAPVACLEKEVNNCPRKGECMVLPLWKGLYDVTFDYLKKYTVQDIIDNFTKSGIDNYVI